MEKRKAASFFSLFRPASSFQLDGEEDPHGLCTLGVTEAGPRAQQGPVVRVQKNEHASLFVRRLDGRKKSSTQLPLSLSLSPLHTGHVLASAVGDANAAAQDKALDALLAWTRAAGDRQVEK